MQVVLQDRKLSSCLLGTCSCKCHTMKISCDLCLNGADEPRFKRKDSFKTNKTDNLNFDGKRNFTIRTNSKPPKPDSNFNSSHNGRFEDN